MGKKFCTKCQKEKPLDDFYKCNASKDGKARYCKECYRAFYLQDKELRERAEMLMAFRTLKHDIKRVAEKR